MSELERIEPMKPFDLMPLPVKPLDEVKMQPVVIDGNGVTTFDDHVSIWRIIAVWVKQTLITEILQMKEGQYMNNDTKATVTGAITALVALAAVFGFSVPADIVTIIIAVGVAVLGYFTNKKGA